MIGLKRQIIIIIFSILFVSFINSIHECYITKFYTITYPKTISDVQKNINEDIIEINDKIVTKWSFLLLVTTNCNNMNIYYLERGFLTLKYKIKYNYENVKIEDEFHFQNRFEKFACRIEENKQIEINPATFVSNFNVTNFMKKWLYPVLLLWELINLFLNRKN